jgi:hypothetical protein
MLPFAVLVSLGGNLVFDIFGPGAATRVAELEGQMVKNHD